MPRGRPAQFDDQDVLDRAAALFQRHGYDAVSVADVCRETGLAMQSLYHRFGDKAGLYREALDRYGRCTNEPAIDMLNDAADPLSAVKSFVRSWRRHRGAGEGDGCLFAQAMALADRSGPDAPREVARRYTQRLRRALTDALRRAVEAGQLEASTDPSALADTLLTLTVGVAVAGRGGLPSVVIDHAVASAMSLLDRHPH